MNGKPDLSEKVQHRGFLIRFIDISLIVLFGFLMISDKVVTTQITLPAMAANLVDFSTSEDLALGVVIEIDGQFAIKNIADEQTVYEGIATVEELDFVLKTMKNRLSENGRSFSVVIDSAPNAPTQSLVDVLDICQRLNLSRTISTQPVLAAPNQ